MTMTHYRMLDREPSAIITVAGSERKIYQDGQIFLNNGENFEFRFFNPLQFKIGVEIIFDGQKKNNGYLVLNPGQDVILDRFLDDKKKMQYETYMIDSSNPAAVSAIALNGLVEIKFYRTSSKHGYRSPGVYYTELDQSYCKGSNGPTGPTGVKGNKLRSSLHQSWSPVTTNSSESFQCFDSSNSRDYAEYVAENTDKNIDYTSYEMNSLIETGRIEKGEESSQDMKTVDAKFESYPFHTITYKLKPASQLDTNISEIRQYCHECAYRIRKQSWKFCPKCGTKLD